MHRLLYEGERTGDASPLPTYAAEITKKAEAMRTSHKEVYLQYVDLLRCKQIIIADRSSAGDCFILFDKLELVE